MSKTIDITAQKAVARLIQNAGRRNDPEKGKKAPYEVPTRKQVWFLAGLVAYHKVKHDQFKTDGFSVTRDDVAKLISGIVEKKGGLPARAALASPETDEEAA